MAFSFFGSLLGTFEYPVPLFPWTHEPQGVFSIRFDVKAHSILHWRIFDNPNQDLVGETFECGHGWLHRW